MSPVVEDFIIVGAGPAGTSAALALVRGGRALRILDAGIAGISLPPPGDYLDLRFSETDQWRWQLGERFEVLAVAGASSPKLRVPGLRRIFDGFAEANRIRAEDGFHLAGALAAGGMSNAWGCGVAAFDDNELAPLDAVQRREMRTAYERAARRMGLSGASDDALRDYFGLDAWTQPALPLDALHARLWARRSRAGSDGMLLGRSRVAVLAHDRDGRSGCDLSGMCLWGCTRSATWSAAMDVEVLRRSPGVTFDAGVTVQRLVREDGSWRIDCLTADGSTRQYRAVQVLLGAGTLATTKLALGALDYAPPKVPLLSNPMAAFMLLLPGALGRGQTRAFGLAQLSLVLEHVNGNEAAFCNLFSTVGLPVSEFLGYLPVTRRAGIPLLRALLPAALVGNIFMPGSLSAHSVSLDSDGGLLVRGGASEALPAALTAVRSRLSRGMRRLGAVLLPGSFTPGALGADLHYAGTLPMRSTPHAHQCDRSGQLVGLPGVYIVDGASLPLLPAKAHTLTIMANADRIASGLC